MKKYLWFGLVWLLLMAPCVKAWQQCLAPVVVQTACLVAAPTATATCRSGKWIEELMPPPPSVDWTWNPVAAPPPPPPPPGSGDPPPPPAQLPCIQQSVTTIENGQTIVWTLATDTTVLRNGASIGYGGTGFVVVDGKAVFRSSSDGAWYSFFGGGRVAEPVPTCPTTTPPPPVNCVVSEWSPWGAWSDWATSTDGQTQTRTRTRTRTVTTQPANGGAACPPLSEIETENRPTPTPAVPAPTGTLRSCAFDVQAAKPAAATGTGWKVQYFDSGAVLTTLSSTIKRAVTFTPGLHPVTAVWMKSGVSPLTSTVGELRCGN